MTETTEIATYCPLCVSRCGALAQMEEGRFVGLRADPSHPTGQALCIKGKVAPEIVYHPRRLLHPMKRTRPKGDADPGWTRITWEEALETAARRLKELAAAGGPECVAFNSASPSTSALSDSFDWLGRLRRAFGSPNQAVSMELCGWGRYLANLYSYGLGLPADCMPDLEHAGTILFWGYNPSVSRIDHATAAAKAQARGAKLVVIDPRRAGLARKADHWLQVRPGSDGGVALGLINLMIARGWYDANFLKTWTNAPHLVRADSGRLLRAAELDPSQPADRLAAWDGSGLAVYDPGRGAYDRPADRLNLFAEVTIQTADGPLLCRSVFAELRDLAAAFGPDAVEEISGVPGALLEATAETLWTHRPLAYMAWSGLEQQSNATQVARAIGLLYALTGNFDQKGGNVQFPAPPGNAVGGGELLSAAQKAKTLGLDRHPLGPARFDHVTSADIYRAAIEEEPYRVRGLVSFGSNLLLAHADGARGREALQRLDFHIHADLFMNPSAEMADIVLPVTSAFEAEALKLGFDTSEAGCSLIQLRKPLVEPRGEARSDIRIIFDLACRLGLGAHFWEGDIDAAYRYRLAPSGVSLEALRAHPEGIRLPLETRYRKFAEETETGPRGFPTPSRKIELYSETLLEAGYPPLPGYEEPKLSPVSQPELATRYPLILTCTKDTLFCETQHRGIASLRRRAPDPQVDLHPAAAEARGIAAGDWVEIATPKARVRARARLDAELDPRVVCGQHGWWEACPEVEGAAYPAVGPGTANFNLVIGQDAVDPVSGSVPLRAALCEVRRLEN